MQVASRFFISFIRFHKLPPTGEFCDGLFQSNRASLCIKCGLHLSDKPTMSERFVLPPSGMMVAISMGEHLGSNKSRISFVLSLAVISPVPHFSASQKPLVSFGHANFLESNGRCTFQSSQPQMSDHPQYVMQHKYYSPTASWKLRRDCRSERDCRKALSCIFPVRMYKN